jgi:hypothetical protein
MLTYMLGAVVPLFAAGAQDQVPTPPGKLSLRPRQSLTRLLVDFNDTAVRCLPQGAWLKLQMPPRTSY